VQQLNFQHAINLPFVETVAICCFTSSELNTSKSKHLLPFGASQLLTKSAPGHAFSQPDGHFALPASICQSPAFSPLTLLLKHATSHFAIKYFLKSLTHFSPVFPSAPSLLSHPNEENPGRVSQNFLFCTRPFLQYPSHLRF